MFYRDIAKILGIYFFGFALTILFPLAFAIYYQYLSPTESLESPSTLAFIYTLITCLAVAGIFYFFGRKTKAALYRREGLVAVVMIWFITPAIAAMPFIYSGTLTNPFMAYFEATSGLTTSGATVIIAKKYDSTGHEIPYQDVVHGEVDTVYTFYGNVSPIRDENGQILFQRIEAIGKPILFWRSFLQWLGGVGIVVLFVAVLPVLGVGGKILFYTEMPGPVKESLTPRIKETALSLWKIYFGLTALQIVVLMMTNYELSLFDAVTISLSTISTGGFSIRNDSIGSYASPTTEWVVMIFMILGGINFSLYYYFIKGKLYRLFDRELLLYLLVILIAGTFVSWKLIGIPKVLSSEVQSGVYSFSDAIRAGFFQVVSATTGTGFSTVDYDKWPYVGQVMILILMYLGGMSGSTAGGIKIIRYYIIFKILKKKINLIFRPETVSSFRIGEKKIDREIMITVLSYFVIVIVFSVLGIFLLSMDNVDPETALGVISSVINNAGLGFREAGPPEWFGFLSNFSLAFTSIWMILGRLEFFAVLLVFVPAFWKTNT